MLQLTEEDVALSFLPLSHSFERMVSYIYLLSGVTVVFAESFDTIGRDLGRVRPTLLTGVPRVFEKLHGRIMDKGQAEPGLKGIDLQLGGRRRHGTRRGRAPRASPSGSSAPLQATVADRLVFAKIREGLGGRIRYLVSGSAPLSAQHRRVLSRHRSPDHRRLRADGDARPS